MALKYLQDGDFYNRMRDGGATPHHVYLRIREDGAGPMASIKILREVFGLSLIEAKEITVQADGLAPSLWKYQEQISHSLEQALEDVEQEDD